MKLHAQTIEKCEERYRTKAEAYFYGFFGGVISSALAVLAAIIIALIFKW